MCVRVCVFYVYAEWCGLDSDADDVTEMKLTDDKINSDSWFRGMLGNEVEHAVSVKTFAVIIKAQRQTWASKDDYSHNW